VRYFRLAAERGDAQAQVNLGVCFENGEGLAQDLSKAVRYYRLAAEQGLGAAQYDLGRCFEHGEGVAQDLVEAMRYYRLAAEQGDAAARGRGRGGLCQCTVQPRQLLCQRRGCVAGLG
jgi:hypothetical protein